MMRYLRLTVLALGGGWIGLRLAAPLDDIFTGLETVRLVFALFGMWVGAVIGGGALVETLRLLPKDASRMFLALLSLALTIIATAYGVIKIADTFLLLAAILLGAAFALFQSAARNRYRYLVIGLVLGALIGTLVSAAGGIQPLSKALQSLKMFGVENFLEHAWEGDFRHRYLGRDREEMVLGGVMLGFFGLLLFDRAVSVLHAFIQGFARGYLDGDSKGKGTPQKRIG